MFRPRPESIIIVRQPDGSVKAFYNVCPHRGNRMVQNDRGSVMQFTCSFHSWQFGLDGGLHDASPTRKPSTRALLDRNPGLRELHCETHAGLVFINMA